MDGRKRAMLVAIVIVALLVAAFLVASCGGGGTTSTTSPGGTQLTNNSQINDYLNQLDQKMNSVNDSGLDENQLNNQSLGAVNAK